MPFITASGYWSNDVELRQARLLLLAATGAVLRQGLKLLGVSAPSRM